MRTTSKSLEPRGIGSGRQQWERGFHFLLSLCFFLKSIYSFYGKQIFAIFKKNLMQFKTKEQVHKSCMGGRCQSDILED